MGVIDGRVIIGAVVQDPRVLHVHPRGFFALVTVAPTGANALVGTWIRQLQTAAPPGGPRPPAQPGAVGHFVLHHENRVGAEERLRPGQGHPLPVVRKFARPISKRIGAVEIGILGPQIGRVGRHHVVRPGRHEGVRGEGVTDPRRKLPCPQVDDVGALVEQLNILVGVIARDGVVHQFVDHDVPDRGTGVVGAGRVGGELVKNIIAIRPAADGHPVGLGLIRDRIQNPRAVRLDQEQRPAGALQAEAQLRRGERNKARRRDHGAGRNHEFVRGRIIRQNAARDVVRSRTVVVEFDKLRHGRVLRMGQELVDDHTAQRAGPVRLRHAGGAAHDITDVPSARIGFTVSRVGQDQGMAGAIGGHRPGMHVGIRDVQLQGPDFAEQLDGPALGQAARVGSHDVGDAVHALNISRGGGDDEETTALQNGAGREGIADVAAADLVSANVLEPGIGIVNLHEFEVLAIGARRGLPHDFGNRNHRLPRSGAKNVVRVRGGGADHRVGARRSDVDELRLGGLGRIVAGHGQPQQHLVGHDDGGAPQLGPREAVIAGEAGESTPDAPEAEPAVGEIRGKRSRRARVAGRRAAPHEEFTVHGGRGKGAGKLAVGRGTFPGHQTGLGERVCVAQIGHANAVVKIPRDQLKIETELVGHAADVAAHGGNAQTIAENHHRGGDRRAADIQPGEGRRREVHRGVRQNRVRWRGAVPDIVDHERVVAPVHQGAGGQRHQQCRGIQNGGRNREAHRHEIIGGVRCTGRLHRL